MCYKTKFNYETYSNLILYIKCDSFKSIINEPYIILCKNVIHGW